ncbi:GNAT family N-acetyltransferase [Sinorhizobium meliloti]|uniref:GNAT family N-acetyltransferase n=1 Tax=Rhizobium meliloti TaxID=382 RepID=UPI0013141E79|nr:GNAT family N-acetyltransferase [Sinorhizobium meliloti]
MTQTEVMATERFKIRAALSSDMVAIGEIVVQSWRHTFDGLVAPEILASLSAEQQATRHTRTFSKPETIYRVATVKGAGTIGFASGGPSRNAEVFDGAELYAIYLRPQFERRGIGRALFEAVATELMETSSKGFYLTALSVNPNRQFYQLMGGREVNAPDIQLGSEFYSQVGFVWKASSGS